jgi:hypothetical protein
MGLLVGNSNLWIDVHGQASGVSLRHVRKYHPLAYRAFSLFKSKVCNVCQRYCKFKNMVHN